MLPLTMLCTTPAGRVRPRACDLDKTRCQVNAHRRRASLCGQQRTVAGPAGHIKHALPRLNVRNADERFRDRLQLVCGPLVTASSPINHAPGGYLQLAQPPARFNCPCGVAFRTN